MTAEDRNSYRWRNRDLEMKMWRGNGSRSKSHTVESCGQATGSLSVRICFYILVSHNRRLAKHSKGIYVTGFYLRGCCVTQDLLPPQLSWNSNQTFNYRTLDYNEPDHPDARSQISFLNRWQAPIQHLPGLTLSCRIGRTIDSKEQSDIPIRSP